MRKCVNDFHTRILCELFIRTCVNDFYTCTMCEACICKCINDLHSRIFCKLYIRKCVTDFHNRICRQHCNGNIGTYTISIAISQTCTVVNVCIYHPDSMEDPVQASLHSKE